MNNAQQDKNKNNNIQDEDFERNRRKNNLKIQQQYIRFRKHRFN